MWKIGIGEVENHHKNKEEGKKGKGGLQGPRVYRPFIFMDSKEIPGGGKIPANALEFKGGRLKNKKEGRKED